MHKQCFSFEITTLFLTIPKLCPHRETLLIPALFADPFRKLQNSRSLNSMRITPYKCRDETTSQHSILHPFRSTVKCSVLSIAICPITSLLSFLYHLHRLLTSPWEFPPVLEQVVCSLFCSIFRRISLRPSHRHIR